MVLHLTEPQQENNSKLDLSKDSIKELFYKQIKELMELEEKSAEEYRRHG